MGTYTANLNLYNTNMNTDGNDTFDFQRDLNDNNDKIDSAVGKLSTLTTTDKTSLVKAINEVRSEAFSRVKKSGDTMTGQLSINKSGLAYNYISQNFDFTVIPSENTGVECLRISDKNSNRMGSFSYRQNTNGSHCVQIGDKKDNNTATYAILEVGWDLNGNAYSNAITPNANSNNTNIATTAWVRERIDGTSITAPFLQLDSGLSGDNSYSKTWDLSTYLPNDSYNYFVWFTAGGRTAVGGGNSIQIWLNTDICPPLLVGYDVNNSSNYGVAGGSIVLPVGTARTVTLTLSNSVGTSTNIWVQAKMIRKIGK